MTQQEIIEGNELIASFLGFQRSGPWWSLPVMFPHNLLTDRYTKAMACNSSQLSFHESWDWLMPVVEKINGNVMIETNNKGCHIWVDATWDPHEGGYSGAVWETHDQPKNEDEELITVVWRSAVKYIQWYNSLSK